MASHSVISQLAMQLDSNSDYVYQDVTGSWHVVYKGHKMRVEHASEEAANKVLHELQELDSRPYLKEGQQVL